MKKRLPFHLLRASRFMFIILGLFAVSCKNTKNITNTTDFPGDDADSLVAYLERTPCFGRCPYYSISIYRSGYVVYEGKKDVEKMGRFFTWLSKETLKEMGETALKAGYFDLNDEYRNPHLTDFPTIYVEVRYQGKKKKITHYDASPPKALTDMEDYIDHLFSESTKWELHPNQKMAE